MTPTPERVLLALFLVSLGAFSAALGWFGWLATSRPTGEGFAECAQIGIEAPGTLYDCRLPDETRCVVLAGSKRGGLSCDWGSAP